MRNLTFKAWVLLSALVSVFRQGSEWALHYPRGWFPVYSLASQLAAASDAGYLCLYPSHSDVPEV